MLLPELLGEILFFQCERLRLFLCAAKTSVKQLYKPKCQNRLLLQEMMHAADAAVI